MRHQFLGNALDLVAGNFLSRGILVIERKDHLLKLRQVVIAERSEVWNSFHRITVLEIVDIGFKTTYEILLNCKFKILLTL